MSDKSYPKTMTITMNDRNNYTVAFDDGRYTDHMTWDEMLGQVAYITCHRDGNDWTAGLFFFGTKEEHEERERRREEWLKGLEAKQ